MPVTQSEIAQHLSLSKATVAKVLGNAKNTWISEETRRRVLAAAHEMGYVPSQSAFSLRTGKTAAVALLMAQSEDAPPLPAFAIGSMAETLGAARHSLVLQVGRGLDECVEIARRIAVSRSCDGLILWPDEGTAAGLIAGLSGLGVPVVIKGRFESLPDSWIQVDFDHEGVMEIAVGEMWSRGHRSLAYLGHDNDFTYARHLRQGFAEAVSRRMPAGLAPTRMARVDYFWQRSCAVMEDWLDGPNPPTAVVIGSDIFSWKGVEIAAARRGRRVGFEPGDLAIAGVVSTDRVLMAGQGLGFKTGGIAELGAALAQAMLGTLADPRATDRTVRIALPLLSTSPLDYFDYGLEVARGLGLV